MITRAVDVTVATFAIVVLSPILLIVAILVRLNLGKPVLFFQQRPGKNEVPFVMAKFRTMLEPYDQNGRTLSDAQRLTRFGKILRSTSIDELPELWNVIKGDMSLVGPRPLLMEYLPLYSERQRLRHRVRPGMTGWAQVNGRNTLSWEEKFELDVWYVENRSIFLDLKIIIYTFNSVLKRHGINAAGEATMAKFSGNS